MAAFIEKEHSLADAEDMIDRLIAAIQKRRELADYLREAQGAATTGIAATLIAKRPRRFLVDMPTQSGKTPIYIRLLQLLALQDETPRTLIITPYRRLVQQVHAEFTKFGHVMPEGHVLRNIGIWYSDAKKLRQVTVTTWPSASALVKNGIIDPSGYDLIFVDEAHLGLTVLRQNLLSRFSNAVIADFSATPAFNADKTLESISELAFRLTPAEAIEKGVISHFRSAFLEENPIDFSGVDLKGDDLNPDQVERLLNDEMTIQQWIAFYRDWVDPITQKPVFGRKGYLNTVSIRRANLLSEKFNAALGSLMPQGIKVAEAIHSDLSHGQQKDIFEKFKRGDIKLLVQIRLAGLGLSDPKADLCLNDAPSISPVEVGQRGGRVIAIDEDNPNKCALIVERADYGRKGKAPLLYGEFMGPGVGYPFKSRAKTASSHLPSGNVLSAPDKVAAFIAKRMKVRAQELVQRSFSEVYPVLSHLAKDAGFQSSLQLWWAVRDAYQRFYPRHAAPSQKEFRQILAGRINPWNEASNGYRLMTIAIAAVLSRHARYVFGAPEDLNSHFKSLSGKMLSADSGQRRHILNLMKKAFNPLTGKRGLTFRDARKLASLHRSNTAYTYHYLEKMRPFDKSTGAADLWAQDFADILDQPVEEVFKYNAALMIGQMSSKNNALPLDHPARLKAAVGLAIPECDTLSVEERIDLQHLENTLNEYLLRLPPHEERLLRMRFGFNCEEHTLEEGGRVLKLTRTRIDQIESASFQDIRKIEKIASTQAAARRSPIRTSPIKIIRQLHDRISILNGMYKMDVEHARSHIDLLCAIGLSKEKVFFLKKIDEEIVEAERKRQAALRKTPVLQKWAADIRGSRNLSRLVIPETSGLEQSDIQYFHDLKERLQQVLTANLRTNDFALEHEIYWRIRIVQDDIKYNELSYIVQNSVRRIEERIATLESAQEYFEQAPQKAHYPYANLRPLRPFMPSLK